MTDGRTSEGELAGEIGRSISETSSRRPSPHRLPADSFSPGCAMLGGREYIVLSSNDYLGLAADARVVEAARVALQRYGVGSRAARSLGGDTVTHRLLEEELAALKSTEAALLFGSGYLCNIGVISALVGPGDAILSDQLNHASIVDGCRLSGAQIRVYSHVDVEDLEEKLTFTTQSTKRLVVTDTIFSMDGDLAPVDQIMSRAGNYNAMVMVDDAHATGVLGSHGQGSTGVFDEARSADAIVGTLGKALGSVGAFVAGSYALIAALTERARTFLFTTSLPASAAAAALEAVRIMSTEPERIRTLWSNATTLHTGLTGLGFQVSELVSPIIAIQLGSAARAQGVARMLADHGILVHAIAPPYVPPSSARLRVLVSAALTPNQLDRCLDAFATVASQLELP